MKKCKKCESKKPITDFYKHPQMADGHINICKACKKKKMKSSWSVPKKKSNSSPNRKPELEDGELIMWVPGCEGRYAVTSFGKVFSYTKNWSTPSGAKEMSAKLHKQGYKEVGLWINGRSDQLVHRLVLSAFNGPPEKGQECRHLDGNPKNNRLENLSWGTSHENYQDTVKHGNALAGESVKCSRLSSLEVYEIRVAYSKGAISQRSLAKKYGVSASAIQKVCSGKNWKHVKGPTTG